MSEAKKDWERPWSTEEILEHADNWNLACDSALLHTLQDFGDKLLNKADEVNKKIENICDNLENVSLQVDLARNEFNSLRNSQFMECRVYEEDETLLTEIKAGEKEDDLPKNETMEDFREAVALGLEVLDKYYEKVEVTVSDSEDEDEVLPSYVYRRKDPYINRPLPHVIGSEQWYKKWHVGLQESSDSEEEKSPSDKYSDSDSEHNSEIKDQSDVSSELSNLSSSNNLKRQPVAVSTANTTLNNDFVTSAKDSTTVSTPKVSSFAEQLAAKLGNVIKENEGLLQDSEVNKRPIQKKPISDFGALFSNEPPPLEDVLEKEKDVHGIFSGGKGLFDDDDEDDDSLWNPSNISSKKQIVYNENNQIRSPKVQGLFEDESDDDIFVSAQKSVTANQTKQPYLQTIKPQTVPIFPEEPPVVEEEKLKTDQKKPTGGVSIFGNTDIFQNQSLGSILKQRRKSSSDDSEEYSTSSKEVKNDVKTDEKSVLESKKVEHSANVVHRNEVPNKSVISKVPTETEPNHKKLPEIKKTSLFDDNDDLFSNEAPVTKKGGLFDDDIFEDDLFSSVSKKFPSRSDKGNLFSDDSFEDSQSMPQPLHEEENISTKKKTVKEDSLDIKNEYDYSWRKSLGNNMDSLFADMQDEDFDMFKPKKIEPDPMKSDEKVENKNKKPEKVEESQNEKEEVRPEVVKPKLSLFDDDFDDVDDLFSQIMKTSSSKKDEEGNESKEKPKENIKITVNTVKEEVGETSEGIEQIGENEKSNITSENLNESSASLENTYSQEESFRIGNSKILQSSILKGDSEKLDGGEGTDGLNVEDRKEVNEEASLDSKRNENSEIQSSSSSVEHSSNSYSQGGPSSKPENEEHRHVSIPHLNFVDNVPPPDDEWENSSDNAFDDYEPYGNDGFHSQRSSLFDNEPPSLFFNETSGVVGDHSDNRFDSVNSFDPSLTSSRRLSSDIFNDFQRNDSLFLTKSLDDSNVAIHSTLQSVPETSDVHSDDNTNITPSGNPDDLYYSFSTNDDSNISKANKSVITSSEDYVTPEKTIDDRSIIDSSFKENKLTPPPDTQPAVSINSPGELASVLDNPDKDETDDLFSARINESHDSKQSENIIIDKADGEIAASGGDRNIGLDKDEISSGKIQEFNEMLSNISKITEQLQEQSTKNDTVKSKIIPGKLNHNLNINVGALIPGSAPPRRERVQNEEGTSTVDEYLSKSVPRSTPVDKDQLFHSKKVTPFLRTVSESDSSKKEYKLEKSISFDNAGDVEILQSMTKDRARIPVKRKPSSRRARQQSLRNSVPDFKLLEEKVNEVEPKQTEPDADGTQTEQSLNPQNRTSEPKQLLSAESIEEKISALDEQLKKPISLFDDFDDDPEDLFVTIQKKSETINRSEIVSTKKSESLIEKESTSAEEGTKNVSKSFEKKIEAIFSNIENKPASSVRSDESNETNEVFATASKKKAETQKIHELFGSGDDSDDFLKSVVDTQKAKKTTSKGGNIRKTSITSKSLFDSSDEDDDFFKTLDGKKQTKRENSTSEAIPDSKKKSLFDDEEEDDLFSGAAKPAGSSEKNMQTSVINKKTPKTSLLRKLEKSEGDEDPLSALLN